MNKKQLIELLDTIPEDQELAIVSLYTKPDLQEMVNETITDEVWQKFAYWFSNDERLNDDANATLSEIMANLSLTWNEG